MGSAAQGLGQGGGIWGARLGGGGCRVYGLEVRGGGAAELGLWAGGEGLQGLLCISWAGGCLARSGVRRAGDAGLDLWSGAGSGGLQGLGGGHRVELCSSVAVWGCRAATSPPALGGTGIVPTLHCCHSAPQLCPMGLPPFLGGQKLPVEQGRHCWESQPSPLLQVLRVLAGKVVVGHAIHNDFKALHYSHPKALTRDTSQIPLLNRRGGFPENVSISLKRLTKALLNQDIQVPWLEPPRTWGPLYHARETEGSEGHAWGKIQGTLSSAVAASPGAMQLCASVSQQAWGAFSCCFPLNVCACPTALPAPPQVFLYP